MLYYDMLYILPALLLTMIASVAVRFTYARYSQVRAGSGITAATAARRILDANGLSHIRIEPIHGDLTDHFDPKDGVIRLSDTVRDSTSIAAIGVAAHECGHAIQYAKEYTPIRIRSAIVPATGVASRLAVPLVLIGTILSFYAESLLALAYAGIILFGICVLFQLITLPVEFNASRRAREILVSEDILSGREVVGVTKVLNAAAMTYVAALATSILQMIRLLSIVRRNR
ncbi:MAG: zinc metallopeptidase [Clostridia bacterium]|nr:zinc metallopeptidase [Clostridia bacterium]